MQDPLSSDTEVKKSLERLKQRGLFSIGQKGRTLENIFEAGNGIYCTLDPEKENAYTRECEEREMNAPQERKRKKKTKSIEKNKKTKIGMDDTPGMSYESDSDSAIESMTKKEMKKKNKSRVYVEKNMRKKDNYTDILTKIRPYAASEEVKTDSVPDNSIWISNNKVPEPTIDSQAKKDCLYDQPFYFVDKDTIPLNGKRTKKYDAIEDKMRGTTMSTHKALEEAMHTTEYNCDDMYYVVENMKRYTSQPNINQEEINKFIQDDCEISSRAKDDLSLHTPHPGQYPCVNDSECKGVPLAGAPLVEHLSTKDIQSRIMSDTIVRRPCIKCTRSLCNYAHINYKAECGNLPTKMLITNYGNIVDRTGEYVSEQCIITGSGRKNQGITVPIPLDVDFYYTVVKIGNITYLQQTGYYKPEDIAEKSAQDF